MRTDDSQDEKSGHHTPGFVSPGDMPQRQSSPNTAIAAASQPLSALHMQIMRRLQWSNERVIAHRQRPRTAQLDDKGASRAIATTQKTSFFRVLACGEQRPCLCPMDSDICARANTTRAAFIAAILNEDVERLGAFASQFVEEPALTLLYKYRFKEFQDAGETQQAGEGRSGGGKTGLMIAASMGLVASAEYLIEVMQHAGFLDLADSSGRTALHMAAQHGNAEIVAMLVRAGAQRARRCHLQKRALEYAEEHEQASVARILLRPPAAKTLTPDETSMSFVDKMRMSNRAFVLVMVRTMRDAFEQWCEFASFTLRVAAQDRGLSDLAAFARLGPPYQRYVHPGSPAWPQQVRVQEDINRGQLCDELLEDLTEGEPLTVLQRHAILLRRSMHFEALHIDGRLRALEGTHDSALQDYRDMHSKSFRRVANLVRRDIHVLHVFGKLPKRGQALPKRQPSAAQIEREQVSLYALVCYHDYPASRCLYMPCLTAGTPSSFPFPLIH